MATVRPVALDPGRVAAWRLGRQRLTSASAVGSPEDVARDLVGVHAQVLSAAALSVAIRTRRLGVDALPQALRDRRVVRSWAMRGTLHVFAAADYPTVVAAIGQRGMWRRPAWLRWFGMTEAELDRTIDAIGEILDDGRPRTRAEIAVELERRLGPSAGEHVRSSWGSLLKLAADRGTLCHASGEGSGVAFTSPRRWLDGWHDVDPALATADLVRRYIGTYGPARISELRGWWGGQPGLLGPALAAIGDDVATVEVGDERALALAADIGAIEATPRRGQVRLLGPFDPLVVTGGMRDRLIPSAHLARVSRTAGWISPTLLVDGVVAGVWASERSGDTLSITVDPFEPLAARIREKVAIEAEHLAVRHGLAGRSAIGPVRSASGPPTRG